MMLMKRKRLLRRRDQSDGVAPGTSPRLHPFQFPPRAEWASIAEGHSERGREGKAVMGDPLLLWLGWVIPVRAEVNYRPAGISDPRHNLRACVPSALRQRTLQLRRSVQLRF